MYIQAVFSVNMRVFCSILPMIVIQFLLKKKNLIHLYTCHFTPAPSFFFVPVKTINNVLLVNFIVYVILYWRLKCDDHKLLKFICRHQMFLVRDSQTHQNEVCVFSCLTWNVCGWPWSVCIIHNVWLEWAYDNVMWCEVLHISWNYKHDSVQKQFPLRITMRIFRFIWKQIEWTEFWSYVRGHKLDETNFKSVLCIE